MGEKLVIYLVALIVAFGAGYKVNSWQEAAARERMREAQFKEYQSDIEMARALGISQGTITITAGQNFAKVQERIVTKVITQVMEVPIYVTKESDKACTVPLGFVRLLNAAASTPDNPAPTLPVAASEPNDASTTLALSGVTQRVVQNYGRCNSAIAQVDELNKWIVNQKAEYDSWAEKNYGQASRPE